MSIRFDDAWRNALSTAESISGSGVDVVLVRDILGRVSAVVSEELPLALNQSFIEGLGKFAASSPVILERDLFAPDAILEGPDLRVVWDSGPQRGRLATVQRSVVGGDWIRPEIESDLPRLALYGFKGGVGRSTAAAMLARRLARSGRCVLVVDLDLESPGVHGLLRSEQESLHGVVDHLVEAAVANESGLDIVAPVRVDGVRGNGEIWISPAEGSTSDSRDYAAKLNRVYSDLPNGASFARRLDAAVKAAEEQVTSRSRQPDIVLLDTRAGIHDIAAVAITQMSDAALLFATDSGHTWHGYGTLFRQWRDNMARGDLDKVRRKIKFVAAMVPGDPVTYISAFRDRSQSCFAEYLYDDVSEGDAEGFNFAPGDVDAPHYPVPILFNSDLVSMNAMNVHEWHSQPLVEAAFEEFLREVELLTDGLIS